MWKIQIVYKVFLDHLCLHLYLSWYNFWNPYLSYIFEFVAILNLWFCWPMCLCLSVLCVCVPSKLYIVVHYWCHSVKVTLFISLCWCQSIDVALLMSSVYITLLYHPLYVTLVMKRYVVALQEMTDASKSMTKTTHPFLPATSNCSLKTCHIWSAGSANNGRH